MVSAALAFFQARSWLLPIIIGAVIGLALIVGAIVIYNKGVASCEAKQAAAVQKAQKAADALSAKLVAAQQDYQKKLEQTTQTIRERIVSVPVTTTCRDSAAIRAAIDGVQQLLGGSSP